MGSPIKSKKPASRPLLPINWEEVEELLIQGCNGVEISAAIGCCPDTLYDRCELEMGIPFSIYSSQRRAKGNSFLHRAQFNQAVNGNTTMLIWLGKNRLTQRDQPVDEKAVETLGLIHDLIKNASEPKSLPEAKAEHKGK